MTPVHPFRPSLLPDRCVTCAGPPEAHAYAVRTGVQLVSPIRPAVARRTDPETSWDAARSVTGIRESQAEVLALFRDHGPLTDEEAFYLYDGMSGCRKQSVSGFRTRRAELVDRHLIRDTGERRRMTTGRRAVVWEAA